MARIVIIEDEPDMQEVVAFNLEDAGHDVQVAASGNAGLLLVQDARPSADLVVLDLMLPDLGGLEVCRRLKQHPATRDISVVMLTAKGDVVDRIVGFELGVDDYVTKPFSVRELLLRIEAVLRRRRLSDPSVIECGALKIDRAGGKVSVSGRPVDLTPMEHRLLLKLYEQRNRVQTRDELLASVWGLSGDVTSRTVDVHIMRLREKLGEAGAYLHTIRGRGYSFDDSREPP